MFWPSSHRFNITTNASKVTVKSGKFRRMHVTLRNGPPWSANPWLTKVPLNPKPKSTSSQSSPRADGFGFRLKPGEGMPECLLLIQQPRPQPVTQWYSQRQISTASKVSAISGMYALTRCCSLSSNSLCTGKRETK